MSEIHGRDYQVPVHEEYKTYLNNVTSRNPDLMLYYREQIAHEREMEKLIQIKDITLCVCAMLKAAVDQWQT